MATQVKMGRIVCTRGVAMLMDENLGFAAFVNDCLSRHMAGDWGALNQEDQKANQRALLEGGRLLSNYVLNPHLRVWVITESDRSVSTVLFPEEY